MRVAAVDIGTNSVRLLVCGPSGEVDRRAIVAGLGRGVDATGVLDETAIERTLEVLGDYRAIIDMHQVEVVGAVATSAVRDARNGNAFLGRAADVLGIRPRLLSGTEEAGMSFRGATAGLAKPPPHCVVDPGGGSTEFVCGSGAVEYAVSIDIGSVRLTERTLPDRPASERQIEAAGGHVDELFGGVHLPSSPATVVGVGGTFTSLAAIALELPEYDRTLVHGATLTLEALERLVDRLASLAIPETEAIPSLDPARAPMILGGAVVCARALARLESSEVVVSESDILDGLAMELITPG